MPPSDRLTDEQVLDRIVYSDAVTAGDAGVKGIESRMARELLRLRYALRKLASQSHCACWQIARAALDPMNGGKRGK